MTRFLMVAALSIFIFGCDATTPDNSDSIEDLFAANKVLTESVKNRRNAYCVTNPTYSKCARWCASPDADCGDGGPTVEEVADQRDQELTPAHRAGVVQRQHNRQKVEDEDV